MKNQLTGLIHSFESFGTLDGPGIRSVVFLQGCRYRCLYCHNPDTWDEKSGTPTTVDMLLNQILRYKPYFDSSNGGVTISGGEPLLQAQFVTLVFRRLKQEGIHTCLDTSGYIPPDLEPSILEELFSYTDLVLLDVKHINSDKHKLLTGHSNHEPLLFSRLLMDYNIPVWLRYVVVPGYTDNLDDIKSFKDFAATLPNVKRIEFLPFHKLGEYKWHELGLVYHLKDVLSPTSDFMRCIQNP